MSTLVRASIILLLVASFSCSGVKRLSESDVYENDFVQIEFTGYMQIGMSDLTVSLQEHGGWRRVGEPPREPHYLGKQFVDDRWPPDVIYCKKNTTPIRVQLVEYIEIGTMDSPPQAGSAWGPILRVYKAIPLHGEIRIQFKYYQDSTCTDEKLFTQIVKH